MSVVSKFAVMLLVVGSFFSGSSRTLTSMANQAKVSTVLSGTKLCHGGCGATCN